jgi:hypothetical protein
LKTLAGKIKQMLDKLIEVRSKGNSTLVNTTKAKLSLKGIDYQSYTATSPDDPAMIKKVTEVAKEMGITL